MQWINRIRQVKILLVVTAVVLSVASLVVSNFLVRDLKREEQRKMEIWAQALRSLNSADENTDLSLVLEVLNSNNTIPVIVVDSMRQVQDYRNIQLHAANGADSLAQLEARATSMLSGNRSIRIYLSASDYMEICYDDSLLLRRLAWWPYVQLGVVLIFVVVAIFALLSSKKAEQNKVWVGLSKETAHQLGTPISSLMAWQEMLRETYPDDPLLPPASPLVLRGPESGPVSQGQHVEKADDAALQMVQPLALRGPLQKVEIHGEAALQIRTAGILHLPERVRLRPLGQAGEPCHVIEEDVFPVIPVI